MKKLLKFEEFTLFLFSIFLFSQLKYAWWVYALWFFAPDLSMVGYVVNTRLGAYIYNFVHHKATAIIVYLLGIYLSNQALQFTGIILFGHSSLDRVLGYGLKYPDSFQNTHLGMIGPNAR